jgi:hypothetical protein
VTPVDKWNGIKPSIKHLGTFGFIAWSHVLDDYRKKHDAKSHACIMMCYSKDSKIYRLFDPVKQEIIC